MSSTFIKYDNRVEAQTRREWLYEYESSQGKPVWPSAWGSDVKEGYLVVPDAYHPVFKDNVVPVKSKRVRVRI